MSLRNLLKLALLLPALCLAEEVAPLDPHLEAFRPLLGNTYIAEFPNSTPEQPVHDVVTYERALNGKAIRSFHSINDGAYGGETIIRWEDSTESLVYHYFTTQGFMTTGTMTVEDGKYTAYEEVIGNADGTTAVRSSGVFSEAKIEVNSEYLTNGKWTPGHTGTYLPAPNATVKFR